MMKEDLKEQLIEAKFECWRDEEFHRDTFTNKSCEVKIGEKTLFVSLEVYVDYYTVRIIWWTDSNKKVAKCYYVNQIVKEAAGLNELICDFLSECCLKYGIDIDNYKI